MTNAISKPNLTHIQVFCVSFFPFCFWSRASSFLYVPESSIKPCCAIAILFRNADVYKWTSINWHTQVVHTRLIDVKRLKKSLWKKYSVDTTVWFTPGWIRMAQFCSKNIRPPQPRLSTTTVPSCCYFVQANLLKNGIPQATLLNRMWQSVFKMMAEHE